MSLTDFQRKIQGYGELGEALGLHDEHGPGSGPAGLAPGNVGEGSPHRISGQAKAEAFAAKLLRYSRSDENKANGGWAMEPSEARAKSDHHAERFYRKAP